MSIDKKQMAMYRRQKMKRIFIRTIPITFIATIIVIGIIPTLFPAASALTEVMKIGLSWPVLAVVLIATVIWIFEYDIRDLVRKVTGLEAGGVKLQLQKTEIPLAENNNHEAIESLKLQNTIWRFRFAEIFLQPYTKTVLVGLNKFPTKVEDYYRVLPAEVTLENRKAILNALFLVEFITEHEGFLFVSELGKTFITMFKLDENK